MTVRIAGLDDWPAAHAQHWRIDARHSNAHTVWQALGSPDWPAAEEIQVIKQHEKLAKYCPDKTTTPVGGTIEFAFALPVHSVSLLVLTRGA